MWRRLDSAQAHGHGLRSWREVRFRLGLAVGRFWCGVRLVIAGAAPPIRSSGLPAEAGRLDAIGRSLCRRGVSADAVRAGCLEASPRTGRAASGPTRRIRKQARMEAAAPPLSGSPRPQSPAQRASPASHAGPAPGHKRKRPRRGGAVCRSGSPARGHGTGWISRRPWTGRRRRPLRPRPIPGLRVPCARARPSRPRRCIPG